ncbi:Uncharacterised protein [Mycobacterium tuberculosis]|uniref:Uncharacterized protein n=1 Tax=Mycobacterium tuberculosis TaxID=1773 RepID=A0A654TIX6_MYCTX|nr:Uncharacterised protein [Mycobacterium tuberculosis]
MVFKFISSGILGLPQSRPCENVQSVVTTRPAAMTSSIGLLANEDNPITVPRAAAARATATSPPGSTA